MRKASPVPHTQSHHDQPGSPHLAASPLKASSLGSGHFLIRDMAVIMHWLCSRGEDHRIYLDSNLYLLTWSSRAGDLTQGTQASAFSFRIHKLWEKWQFLGIVMVLKCSFLKIYLFIYFWLCWVFAAARGLSLVAASRGYSSLRCAGFSLRWLLLLRRRALGAWASVVVARGSSSCGSRALEHKLGSCGTRA